MSKRFEIRQIAASYDGTRIALGEFEHVVYVWDLESHTLAAAFTTILDFGGGRLAIDASGSRVVAGAYHVHGVCCYNAVSGRPLWQRRDLKRVQTITIAGSEVFCGIEGRSMHVVSLSTGVTLRTLRAVEKVTVSPWRGLRLLHTKRKGVRLVDHVGTRIADMPTDRHGVVAAAFGRDAVVVTESAGAVWCFNTAGGTLRWRYTPPRNHHLMALGWRPDDACFLGVQWPYQHGGDQRLLRFDSETGTAEEICRGFAHGATFIEQAHRLVTVDGSVLETRTGRVVDSIDLKAAVEGPPRSGRR